MKYIMIILVLFLASCAAQNGYVRTYDNNIEDQTEEILNKF